MESHPPARNTKNFWKSLNPAPCAESLNSMVAKNFDREDNSVNGSVRTQSFQHQKAPICTPLVCFLRDLMGGGSEANVVFHVQSFELECKARLSHAVCRSGSKIEVLVCVRLVSCFRTQENVSKTS